CATCRHDGSRAVVPPCMTRWTGDTTCEESRAHLGIATQRQWSDRAIERPTPCVCGRSAVVTRLAHARHRAGKVPMPRAAWYPKSHATCAAVLAVGRQHLGGDLRSSTSPDAPDLGGMPRSALSRL